MSEKIYAQYEVRILYRKLSFVLTVLHLTDYHCPSVSQHLITPSRLLIPHCPSNNLFANVIF